MRVWYKKVFFLNGVKLKNDFDKCVNYFYFNFLNDFFFESFSFEFDKNFIMKE